MWLAWVAGCGDEAGSTDSATSSGPTGPSTDPAPCHLSADNPLRVECTARFDVPAPATLVLTAGAAERVRTFSDPTSATEHRIVGWGLVPSTTYRYALRDEATGEEITGTVATGALPEPLLDAQFTATTHDPDASAVDLLLIPSSCPAGYVLMVDALGRIVWYQDVYSITDGGASTATAATWTPRGTVVLLGGKGAVTEFTPAGEVRFRAESGVAFEGLVHHDVFERDGYVYVPQARQELLDGVPYVIDRVLVFDSFGAQVDAIDTLGLYPTDVTAPWMFGGYWMFLFPSAVDFTHTNSVSVDPAGDVWVSFRHLHAFAKFSGGPGTDAFGTLLWTAVGSDTSPIAALSAFTLAGDIDPTYTGQHDVHLAQDGTVLLLDNGLPSLLLPTRAVRYAIDEAGGVLTAVGEWDLGATCPTQGTVRELPNGHLVAACSAAGSVAEFRPDGGEPVWELAGSCKGVATMRITRAIPVLP